MLIFIVVIVFCLLNNFVMFFKISYFYTVLLISVKFLIL